MLNKMISMIASPNREKCMAILQENLELFKKAHGSSHNHQAWTGGYLDHITEVMQIATKLYESLSSIRPLPFMLSDAQLVLFLHDIEKPWKQKLGKEAFLANFDNVATIKEANRLFRVRKIYEYGIILTYEQQNALTYVEGEGDDYSPKNRIMNELAAFCHICDITSARIWYDYGDNKP